MPLGSIASWISRATSSSPFSDSRSATSSSTSRLTSTRLTSSANVPSAQAGTSMRDLEERRAERQIDEREAAEQLDEAEQRDRQRAEVQRPPRRRQLEREGDEHLAEPRSPPASTRAAGELLLVQPAAEEPVRVPRVVREQPLQVLAGQIAGVSVEPLPRAIGARRSSPAPHSCSGPHALRPRAPSPSPQSRN